MTDEELLQFCQVIGEHESRGDYQAYNPKYEAGGAYQFLPETWDAYCTEMGLTDYVGIAPQDAPPAVQDNVMMYVARGYADTFNGDVRYMADAHYAGVSAAIEHYNQGYLPENIEEGGYESQASYGDAIVQAMGGSSPYGDIARANFNQFTHGDYDYQQRDFDPDELYSLTPPASSSWYERLFKPMYYSAANTGFADVVQQLYGDVFHSKSLTHMFLPEPVTQEDIDYVKMALPNDEDAQRAILLHGVDSENIKWLVNQKLVANKQMAEIDEFNNHVRWDWSHPLDSLANECTLANVGSLVGGLFDPINLIPVGRAETLAKKVLLAEGVAKTAKARTSGTINSFFTPQKVGKGSIFEAIGNASGMPVTKDLTKTLTNNKLPKITPKKPMVRSMGTMGVDITKNIDAKLNAIKLMDRLGKYANTAAEVRKWAELGAANTGIQFAESALEREYMGDKVDWSSIATSTMAMSAILGFYSRFKARRANNFDKDIERVVNESKMANAEVAMNPKKVAENLDSIINETHNEARQYHDANYRQKVGNSRLYGMLEDADKIVTMTYEQAAALYKKFTNKVLPKGRRAFYVPNEDYAILIKDNIKASNIDGILEHEYGVHASLKQLLGKSYDDIMSTIADESRKEGTVWYKYREKSVGYDPEEILATAIEDGDFFRDNEGFINKILKNINSNYKGMGFISKLTRDNLEEIMTARAREQHIAPEKVYYDSDTGKTAFGGIRFSTDMNTFSPLRIEETLDPLNDALIMDGTGLTGKVRKLMRQGYYGVCQNSWSPTLRKLGNILFDNVQGQWKKTGNLLNAGHMSAEMNARRIELDMNRHYAKYLGFRNQWLDANGFKTRGREGIMAYNKLCYDYYNYKYGGNRSVVRECSDPLIAQGAEAFKEWQESRLSHLMHSADEAGLGGKRKNVLPEDYRVVDHELPRQSDKDACNQNMLAYKSEEGVNGRTCDELQFEDWCNYYDMAAKRDVVKAIIERDIDRKNKAIQEANDKIPEGSKRKPQELLEKKVTDEMVEEWLKEHIPKAVRHTLRGNPNAAIEHRVPIDTSMVVPSKFIDGFEFSYDNNLRSYDVDYIISNYNRRVAGMANIKNVFGSKEGIARERKQIEKELMIAQKRKDINTVDVQDTLEHFDEMVRIIGGQSPRNKTLSRLEAFGRIWRNLSYAYNGTNMMWAQLSEVGNTIGYGGFKQIFSLFPPARKFMQDIMEGKVSSNALEEARSFMWGVDMAANLFDRGWGDNLVRRSLTSKSPLDSCLRGASDVSYNMGKITSVVNMLPKLTDSMVKGMQAGFLGDAMRWARGERVSICRNPFTRNKLRAAGVSPELAEQIRKDILKYSTFDEMDNLVKFDVEKWNKESPNTYVAFYRMADLHAQRGIVSGANIGNRNLTKDTNWVTQCMFQFKDFALRAIEGQSFRAMTARDVDDGISMLMSGLTSLITYGARYKALESMYSALGDEERAKRIRDTMFTSEQMIRAATLRSSILGSPFSFANDVLEGWTGANSIRTTVSRRGRNVSILDPSAYNISPSEGIGNLFSQVPALTTMGNMGAGLLSVFRCMNEGATKRDMQNFLNVVPLQKFLPMSAVVRSVIDKSDLPTK